MFNRYPYTDFHEMNLDWFLSKFTELLAEWFSYKENWEKWKNDTTKAFEELREYVFSYFAKLDITKEISDKIDAMFEAHVFDYVLEKYKAPYTDVYAVPMNKLGDLPIPAEYYPQGMAYADGFLYVWLFPFNLIVTPNKAVAKIKLEDLTLDSMVTFDTSKDAYFCRGNGATYDRVNEHIVFMGGATSGEEQRNVVILNKDLTVHECYTYSTSSASTLANFALDDDSNLSYAMRYYTRTCLIGENNAGINMFVQSWVNDYVAGVLQDAHMHNRKSYQMYHYKDGTRKVPYSNMIVCSYPGCNVPYMRMMLEKPEESQGLTRNDENGHYLVSFVDGELYDIGVLPSITLYDNHLYSGGDRFGLERDFTVEYKEVVFKDRNITIPTYIRNPSNFAREDEVWFDSITFTDSTNALSSRAYGLAGDWTISIDSFYGDRIKLKYRYSVSLQGWYLLRLSHMNPDTNTVTVKSYNTTDRDQEYPTLETDFAEDKFKSGIVIDKVYIGSSMLPSELTFRTN